MTKIAHLKSDQDQDNALSERKDENLTRVARATAKAGADVVRESAGVAQATADAAQGLHETTRQMAKESPEVARAFADVLEEQTRQNVETLRTFARAVNWTDVAQAQSKLIAGSYLRFSQFSARYGEFLLRGMTSNLMLPGR